LVLFLSALDIRCRLGGPRLYDTSIDLRPPPAIFHELLAPFGADGVSVGEFPFAASVKTILHQLFREIEHQADGEKPTDNDQDVEHRILVRQAINISLILLTFANVRNSPYLSQRACLEKGAGGKNTDVSTQIATLPPANDA
jgi:hypothetical protein